MFLEPGQLISGAKTGIDIWKNRNALQQTVRRVFNRLKHGKMPIAVFGPGGTGKTTLSKFLTEDFRWQTRATTYKESVGIERVSLPGDLVCDLIVAPGQELRRENTWNALYQTLGKSKSCGVINVVSWGLHSLNALSFREHGLYRSGMTAEAFMTEYSAQCRQIEIKIIRELQPRLEDAPGKLWMMTLVTKQDLWWNERVKVQEYYRGEYDVAIQDVLKKRGARHFRHEYVSASLVLNNLSTENREILVPTTEGYDETIQLAHLHRLMDTLYALTRP